MTFNKTGDIQISGNVNGANVVIGSNQTIGHSRFLTKIYNEKREICIVEWITKNSVSYVEIYIGDNYYKQSCVGQIEGAGTWWALSLATYENVYEFCVKNNPLIILNVKIDPSFT